MSELKPLTKEELSIIVSGIKDGFNRYGISISPNSDIDSIIKYTLFLSEYLDRPYDVLTETERRKVANAYLRIDQAMHIAHIFNRLRKTQIPKNKVKFLKKRLDRLSIRGDSKAPDILFEMEVAGRLAGKHPNLVIKFDEPDIVVEYPNGRVGFSCKRPKNETRLFERIKEAAEQGKRTNMPFFVVISADEILIPASFIEFRTRKELDRQIKNSLTGLMKKCTRSVKQAFEKGAGGVILCARKVAFIREPSFSICWRLRHKYRANPNIENVGYVLKYLINIMEQ